LSMSAFDRILGSELLDKTTTVPTSSLSGKIVGLYFSAHWCGPCRQFTPILSGIYQQLQKEKKAFEIVFVSSDKDEKSFKEYFASMPWKALPFNSERKGTLGQSYGVQGIPTLVLLDPDGKTITANGREMIQSQGAKGFPFGVKLKEEEDKKRKDEKLKEQAILAPKQAALGQEPADGAGVVTIQINTPNGQKTQRRFYETQTIQDVEKFVSAFDISLAKTAFCVRTNLPRPGVNYTISNQLISEAFPSQKRIALFVQKGISSKPGKVTSQSLSSSTPSAPSSLDKITNVRIVASEWTCNTCTFKNIPAASACEVCGQAKS